MTTKVHTQNKGEVVMHTHYRPKVSGYTVYNNKVYKVVGSEGSIIDYAICLESEVDNEHFWVKQPESGRLRQLVSPTGYIKC